MQSASILQVDLQERAGTQAAGAMREWMHAALKWRSLSTHTVASLRLLGIDDQSIVTTYDQGARLAGLFIARD